MFLQFASLIFELSQSNQTLIITKQLHALIIRALLFYDPFYATRIVRFYAINNDLQSARKLFDKTPDRSVYLWNSMIRAYARDHKFNHAFSLFSEMLSTESKPDNFTFACILHACSENSDQVRLRIAHGGVIVSGLGTDFVSSSALVTAYSKLGLVDEAYRVFCGMPESDLVMWNSMVSGYGCGGFWDKGLELFRRMRITGEKPDGYTLVGLISGFGDPNLLEIGKGIHGICLKYGFDSNSHVASSLVSMYSKCNCLNSAYRVFRSLSQADLVLWSALITGFSHSGDSEEALLLFREMIIKGKRADPILIASVLAACARLAIVKPGREIHGYMLRCGIELEIMVSSALLDMYSKCGFADLGVRVFEIMPERNVISYNSVISGLGSHGLTSQAFKMFVEMLEKRFKPDESTFSALLSACCHAGLVKDGQKLFRRMNDEFGIPPRVEHYVLMVKLLGMAGELEEAYNLIQSMPEQPDSGIWGALLSCCSVHRNSELGEVVAYRLFETEPEKSAYKVMLANIYAEDGRWDDVKKLRDDMMEGGLRKTPGLSWIGDYGI
ncbi:hypothetical protein HHK36_015629 [Tetracentron sinense]|uniref:Pentatricopeptide repeat-containing protein n=1 Tax=Tetracentron sinense TaxID=13715 RepID=A0A834Z7L7_TETSI|nr:hypothetical protein HHK36_015629 [Tetracentron sinense]